MGIATRECWVGAKTVTLSLLCAHGRSKPVTVVPLVDIGEMVSHASPWEGIEVRDTAPEIGAHL